MIAVIDADSLVYSVGFATESKVWLLIDEETLEPAVELRDVSKKKATEMLEDGLCLDSYVVPESEAVAKAQTRESVDNVIDRSGATDYKLYLTDGTHNFRKEIDLAYKANRKDFVRPVHYDLIREVMINDYGAIVCDRYEADDALAIEGWAAWNLERGDVLLCSIDKDLDQVPGYHYRWETHNKLGGFYWLSEEDARRNYWTSVLTGDLADNIVGLHRIGPKRAGSILYECRTDKEFYRACWKQYEVHERLEDLDKNCRLLYLLRSPDDEWRPPTCK